MENVLIECPDCGFSRQVPSEKIPANVTQITCPKCQKRFNFDQELEIEPPAAFVQQNRAEDWQEWQDHSQQETAQAEALNRTAEQTFSFGEVLNRAIAQYRAKVVGLTLLFILTMVLAVVPWGVLIFAGTAGQYFSALPYADILIFLLPCVMSLFGWVYGFGAMVAYVVEDGSVSQALRSGQSRFTSLLWLSLLFLFLYIGGLSLFVLPGLVFLFLFSLSFFVLFVEKETGMNALLISSQYVQRRFFSTLIKVLVLWLVSSLLTAIPVVGLVATFVVIPFSLIYLNVIFDDLRDQAGFQRQTPTSFKKFSYLMGGTLGYLLLWAPLVMLYFNIYDVRRFVPEKYSDLADVVYHDVGRGSGLYLAGGGMLLPKQTYAPGEMMKVSVVWSDELSERALLCCSGKGESCKNLLDVDVSRGKLTTMKVAAPDVAGVYELRLFAEDNLDQEVSLMEFEVH